MQGPLSTWKFPLNCFFLNLNQHLLIFSAGGLWENKMTTHNGGAGGLQRNRETASGLGHSAAVEQLLPQTLSTE